MSREGSECSGGTCVSGTLCSLRELAAGSEWERAAERLSQGHRCCSACVESALHRAVQEQQWDCAVRLSENCSGLQRSKVVHALMAHGQWGGVVQLMKLSITSETVRAVVERAVQEGQWECIRQILKTGLRGRELGWLCEQAADRQQWDVVMQLVEMGVTTALRNQVWQSAVLHHHVPCAAKLIESGVSHRYKVNGIQNEIMGGQCEFVLQVVKMVEDPELTKVVLQESLKQKQWPLVGELVKEGLSVAQMEAACAQAVADRQWTVALQLLRGGVSASQWMVDEFFENRMAPALLDLLPAGYGGDSLRGLLLMGSIRHGQGDFTLRLLQQLSVSDTELMEAMKYAVHLLDKTMLLLIIRASPRSPHVFRREFLLQDWQNMQPIEYLCDRKGGDEICWLFETFYAAGEKNLALYVATSGMSEPCLIVDFCKKEKHNFNLKQGICRYVLRKLYEADADEYGRLVEDLYKMPKTPWSDRSFLFCEAVEFGQFGLATSLCEHGVSLNDLKFAAQWLFQSNQYGAGSHSFLEIICRIISEEDCVWLNQNQYAIRFAMRQYFRQRSDAWLKHFIKMFVGCHDKQFTGQIFREAVRQCVKFDCLDLFLQLCRKHLKPKMYVISLSEFHAVWEDGIFACTCAVIGNRPHFLEKICKENMPGFDLQLIINIVAEKEAWNVLLGFSAGLPLGGSLEHVVENFVQKMLADQATWPALAPVLCKWIAEEKLEPWVLSRLHSRFITTRQKQWSESLSILKDWCVDTGHANLAFFLALVSMDWALVDMLVNTRTSLDPHPYMLLAGVGLAAEAFQSSTCAAILGMCPVNAQNLARFTVYWGKEKLAKACELEGLQNWALILNCSNWNYIEAHHRQCQNPAALHYILERAAEGRQWDLVRQLITRCTDSGTQILQHALQKAVMMGQVDSVEALISLVDPSTFGEFCGPNTLLFTVVAARHNTAETRWNMVRLCVAAGLSTLERDMPLVVVGYSGNHNCSLSYALTGKDLKIVQLLLVSGACSYKKLHKFRCKMEKEGLLRKGQESGEWPGYRYVSEAAATPSSLVHLTRLAVSRSIGCQPGRSDRIQDLSLPETVRELLRFEDVLTLVFKET